MGTRVDSEVIILSDEDEPEEGEESVLIVEVEHGDNKNDILSCSALEEDLVVTFTRRPDLLPHARFDCPIQPFVATECELIAPLHNNQLICVQCFCYICDKLASLCEVWSTSGVCHCNSHKKSTFWHNQRNSCLLGGLQNFNLTLCEIDSHLRHAETLLQRFKEELSVKFSVYLSGKAADESTAQGQVFDYSPVHQFVSCFLDLAEKQDCRAGAIMQLGAAELFVRHYPCPRMIAWFQRRLVMGEFTGEFAHKLQEFYKKLHLPHQLKALKNSLCVRPWDDVLLGSVLRGQNVHGFRKDKGKKDILLEQTSVVRLRLERLQQQGRYRELCRYIRVVQTDDPKVFYQFLDLIPFFLCVDGQLCSALQNLLSSQSFRLSPRLFLSYLHIFTTATAPVQILRVHADLCSPNAAWKPIPGAAPLKHLDLVKFALKAQVFCPDILNDESKDLVKSLLVLSKNTCNFHIPRHFQEDQALLLLLIEALSQRLQAGPFSPVLPVLRCFQNNVWALRWLRDGLSSSERLSSFISEVTQEMDQEMDQDQSTDKSLGFLHTLTLRPCKHTDQPSKVEREHPK